MFNFFVKRKEIEELKNKLDNLEKENLELRGNIRQLREITSFEINRKYMKDFSERIYEVERKVNDFTNEFDTKLFKHTFEEIKERGKMWKKILKLD